MHLSVRRFSLFPVSCLFQCLRFLYTQKLDIRVSRDTLFCVLPRAGRPFLLLPSLFFPSLLSLPRGMSVPPPFENRKACNGCQTTWTLITRQHHCRNCGRSYCNACSKANIPLPHYKLLEPQRVCDECLVHVQNHYKRSATTSPSNSAPAPGNATAPAAAAAAAPQAAPLSSAPAASAASPSPPAPAERSSWGGGGGASATPTFFSPSSSQPSSSISPLHSSAASNGPARGATQQPQPQQGAQEDEAKASHASAMRSSAPAAAAASSPSSSAESASARPKPVARTQFQSFGSSGFSGFGRQSSVQYDLSGNLDDQCRDAIKNNDSAGVTKLLQAGANARYVDHTGNSLLHLAAMFDRYDIARQLIAKGASLTEKNPAGETPMDIAPPSMQHKLLQQQQQLQQQQATAS